MDHYSDNLENHNMGEIWTEEAHLKASEWNKTSLGPRLKVIHINFLAQDLATFCCVWQILVRLNMKVMDKVDCQRKFQEN